MSSESILIDDQSGVREISLNRPQKLNALTLEVLRDLISAYKVAESDDTIRVIVLSGSGRGFCSGWDRGEGGEADNAPDVLANDSLGSNLIEAILASRKITVARLHGAVIGGAVLLAAACDFRIASESAYFWMPEVGFGNPIVWTGLSPLVKEIGFSNTRYIALSNQKVDSSTALQWGLLHNVSPDDELLNASEQLVSDWREIPPRGIRMMKDDLDRVGSSLLHRHGHSASDVYSSLTSSAFSSL